MYKVISRKEGLPVYSVQREDGDGPVRTLHRNLLLPLGVIDEDVTEQTEVKVIGSNKPKMKQPPKIEVAEEPDSEEQTLVITVDQTPQPILRPTAPVFVPAAQNNLRDNAEEQQENAEAQQDEGQHDQQNEGQQDTSTGESQEEEVDEAPSHDADASYVNGNSNGSQESGNNSAEGQEDDPGQARNVEQDSTSGEDDSEQEDSEEDSGESANDASSSSSDGEQPARRSIRVRRPPDRLNLAHVAKTRVISTPLIEEAVRRLNWLSDVPLDDDTIQRVEWLISGLFQVANC